MISGTPEFFESFKLDIGAKSDLGQYYALKSSSSDFFKYNVDKYQKLETINLSNSNEIIYLTIWNDESSASAAKFEVLFYPAPEIIVESKT